MVTSNLQKLWSDDKFRRAVIVLVVALVLASFVFIGGQIADNDVDDEGVIVVEYDVESVNGDIVGDGNEYMLGDTDKVAVDGGVEYTVTVRSDGEQKSKDVYVESGETVTVSFNFETEEPDSWVAHNTDTDVYYDSIQSALDSVAEGETIRVSDSQVHNEALHIDTDGVTLKGVDTGDTAPMIVYTGAEDTNPEYISETLRNPDYVSSTQVSAVDITADNVTVSNLNIQSKGLDPMMITGDNVTLKVGISDTEFVETKGAVTAVKADNLTINKSGFETPYLIVYESTGLNITNSRLSQPVSLVGVNEVTFTGNTFSHQQNTYSTPSSNLSVTAPVNVRQYYDNEDIEPEQNQEINFDTYSFDSNRYTYENPEFTLCLSQGQYCSGTIETGNNHFSPVPIDLKYNSNTQYIPESELNGNGDWVPVE
jgi:hypothetical protein